LKGADGGLPGQFDRDHNRNSQCDSKHCQAGADRVAAQWTDNERPQQPENGVHEVSISAMRPSRIRTRVPAIEAASTL
jgi:hypothetical protein